MRIGTGSFADWSPDSRRIVFQTGDHYGEPAKIFVQNRDGTGVVPLTDTRNYNPSWQPLPNAAADFDGDGKSDISVFRPSDRTWYLNRSTEGFTSAQFGIPSDKITADYDGDGKTDIAVYRDGTWWRINSSDLTIGVDQYGTASDIPVPADYYDGDGRADLAVFRPSNGTWYFKRSSQGFLVAQFGTAEDDLQVGDLDGDGKADLAVRRPSDNTWYLLRSTAGFAPSLTWGEAGDAAAPADFDGDGKTDIAVFQALDRGLVRRCVECGVRHTKLGFQAMSPLLPITTATARRTLLCTGLRTEPGICSDKRAEYLRPSSARVPINPHTAL